MSACRYKVKNACVALVCLGVKVRKMAHWKALIGSSLIVLASAWLNGQTTATAPQGSGTIQGLVLFVDGTPAHTGKGIPEEVAVNVEVQTSAGVWARFGGAAHTDEHGHYQIERLPAGKYLVFAAFPGEWVQTSTGRIKGTGPLSFAPGVVRPSKAQVITLTGNNDVEEANVRIPSDSHHKISGRVMTADGKAANRGIVRLYASGEPDLSRASPLAEDGTFEFTNVADEEYTVSASSDGAMKSGSAEATVLVHAGGDPEPLRLMLPASSSE
jgi:hypothetical protein